MQAKELLCLRSCHHRTIDLHSHASVQELYGENQYAFSRLAMYEDSFHARQGTMRNPHPFALLEIRMG
jgi:hypothetical protein